MSRCFALGLALAVLSGCARVSPFSDGIGGNGSDVDLATPATANVDLGGDVDPLDLTTAPARDLATPPGSDLAVIHDLAMPAPPHDLATAPPDLVVVANCHLVINEVQTGTTATLTEEFVEIYNPCGAAVTVDGWKLAYRAATNTASAAAANDSSSLYTFAGSIAAGGYFVLGGSGFAGTKNGALASGIAASGAVALRDGSGNIVDSVAWGTITTGNAFVEGAAAPLPPVSASPGSSIARLPNGTDSDHNNSDFQTDSASTPGAANH